MVECEYISTELLRNLLQVLIDTWWNVNELIHAVQCTGDLVLIDTWWNVNVMVSMTVLTTVIVLIDTWWNVNVVFLYDLACVCRF